MKLATPKIDKRTFNDLLRQTQALAPFYTPEWVTGQKDEPGQALLKIYLHMQGQVLSRLNRVPDKNFIVFLDMMGIKLLPAQSAQARVTFTLAKGTTEHVLVPKGTLLSGEAADGSGQVTFQTQKDLLVTPANLQRIFSFDLSQDSIYEHTQDDSEPQPFTVFTGRNEQEHSLYLGHADLLNQKMPTNIKVEFLLAETAGDGSDLNLVWEYFDGARWAEITRFKRDALKGTFNDNDGTRLFTTSGSMTLVKGQTAEIAETEVGGVKNRWIRCRLVRKLLGDRPVRLPTINTVRISVKPTNPMAPDLAFNNDIPLNLEERINPFGKLPVVFDTFYIASDEAFSKRGAQITLELAAEWKGYPLNPEPAPNAVPPPPDPVLSWEYWNGKSWRGLRVTDTTDRFKKIGEVIFTCPDDIEKVEVNGEEKFWVRVRLIDGDYGKEIILTPKGSTQVDITPGKIYFPVISNLLIDYEGAGEPPEKCLTLNNLNSEDRTAECLDPNRAFAPFTAMPEQSPGLFLGFDKALRGGPLSILFNVEEQFLSQDARVKVLWFYWDGGAWAPINLLDETESLTRIGALEFIVGRDFASRRFFGHELFWLKGSFVEGGHPEPPQVKSLHPNTTYALQADVANNELAGSSNGTAGQEFALQHQLVISQQVFVREPTMPAEEEQEAIRREEGRDAISVKTNELGETIEILVRWHAVDDFDDSGPQGRHYTIDQRLGRVKFGDGNRGMVPPVGADNVIVSYTYGGGRKGNVPVNAISGLKSAVPFVNAVTNHLVADGGSETETLDDVLTSGPLLLKNRNRAVTPEDFEALARGASRKVARAKCLPNTDEERNVVPGWVTVMIVPDSGEAAPRPSQQLVKVVADGLERHSANVVSSPGHIHVTGPDYREVIVEATVVPTSLEKAAAVETSLREKLNRYIHPLTGGPCGTGWEFGHDICLSEIIALSEGVEDVDHVEKIVLRAGGRAYEGDVPLDKYALPFSGEHRISVVLDGSPGVPDPCRASQNDCAVRQEFKPAECPKPVNPESLIKSKDVY